MPLRAPLLLAVAIAALGCDKSSTPKDPDQPITNGRPPAAIDAAAAIKSAPPKPCDDNYQCRSWCEDCGDDHVGLCIEGQCERVALPPRGPACTQDSDCTITMNTRGNCCGIGCGPSEIAVHVTEDDALKAWENQYCGRSEYTCKEYRCAQADYSTKAVCREGACESVQVPDAP